MVDGRRRPFGWHQIKAEENPRMNPSGRLRGICGVLIIAGLLGGSGCESSSANSKPEILTAQSTGAATKVEREGPPRVMASGQLAADVKFGRVLSATPVMIEGKRGIVGGLGGAAAGGMAVKPKISSVEDLAIGTIGAIGGSVVGQATQEAMTRTPGQEITIGLENGEVLVISQDAEGGIFREGTAVKIVQGPQGAYVTPATADDREKVAHAREAAGQPSWYEKAAEADESSKR